MGNDLWLRGWVVYVDEKFFVVKIYGNDIFVFVGNVYINDLIVKIWNEIGFDFFVFLEFLIIVLNGIVLIIGSFENFYLIYELFVDIKENIVKIVVVILSIIVYVVILMLVLRRDGSYVGSIFLMGVFFLGEWVLFELIFVYLILKIFYFFLVCLNGVFINDVFIVIIFYILEVFFFDERLFWVVRWFLIFVFFGVIVYIVYRRECSLGIVVFFLVFFVFLFREWFLILNDILGLLVFVVVVVIVCSLNFVFFFFWGFF